jgi:pSer/pThr/pTyr-binding forkhead associated (FHA) protein
VVIDRAELLVGRHDDRRDIHPEISLHDPGASRRHAKFVVLTDGQVALQDLAATNGTNLNGVEVASGARHTLKDGDVVTLGRWTRIRLEKA